MLMRLAAVLCAFIGFVQFVFSHSLFGLVWVIAGTVLFAIDRYYDS